MGYAPDGVTRDAIRMDEFLSKLKIDKQFLIDHPEETTRNGKTLPEIEEDIERIKNFRFLP